MTFTIEGRVQPVEAEIISVNYFENSLTVYFSKAHPFVSRTISLSPEVKPENLNYGEIIIVDSAPVSPDGITSWKNIRAYNSRGEIISDMVPGIVYQKALLPNLLDNLDL